MLTSDRVKALLDRKGLRLILGPAASLLARRQKNGVQHIFFEDGVWIHEATTGYFAYRHPFVHLDLNRMDEAARANFFWKYQPRPGDVVVDAGAGVGEETLSFSRAVGPTGKVVCVEAHPRTYRCLEKLKQYNNLTNVICIHRAVADVSNSIMRIADSDTYLANHVDSSQGTPVRTITVDGLCHRLDLSRIHFLKMNIEGAERLAIRGMRETLKQTEVVCISCHDFLAARSRDQNLNTKNDVRCFLEENGIKTLARNSTTPHLRDQVWGINEQLLREPGHREVACAS